VRLVKVGLSQRENTLSVREVRVKISYRGMQNSTLLRGESHDIIKNIRHKRQELFGSIAGRAKGGSEGGRGDGRKLKFSKVIECLFKGREKASRL